MPYRKTVALVAPSAAAVLVGAVLLSACGSSSGGGAAPEQVAATGSEPVVSGAVDSQPTIAIPKTKPPTTTQVTIVTRGSGTPVASGDLAVVNGYGRTWTSADAFENTYDASTPPDTLPVGTGQLTMTGLDKALLGVPVGSRVLVVIPPSEGFGEVSSLPSGVKKTDTAVLVFDLIAAYSADAGPAGAVVASGGGSLPTVTSTDLHSEPSITIPKTAAPDKLSITTLVQGSGPAVVKGQELVVQYVGDIWASGKEFDSSWSRHLPSAFPVGEGQLISAWDTGLIGVKVGSRVMIVAPPADAYGSAGQPSAGISGTDTLVFVIDVLGAYNS
jgi:FKBP-type peptidyl-prolyl cis-trans isomerase